MNSEPDRFDNSVSGIIKSLRLLIANGSPELKEERQRLLYEFLDVNDEFEATDPKGKTRDQIRQDLQKMPELKIRYEAAIAKIREYCKARKEDNFPPPVA